jgi:hypothetical protein
VYILYLMYRTYACAPYIRMCNVPRMGTHAIVHGQSARSAVSRMNIRQVTGSGDSCPAAQIASRLRLAVGYDRVLHASIVG